jgi:hypothetical protein
MPERMHGGTSRPERHIDRPLSGFNFTQRMRILCEDIVQRCPELGHVRMDQVAVTWTQAKRPTSHGLHASLTPLRFRGGLLDGHVGRRRYTVERMYDPRGNEYLYLLTFCLPRFLDLDFGEKLTTVFHELWHISPSFDGDLRRHPGRCYAHTGSQRSYDQQMKQLARQWFESSPPAPLYDFLHLDFATLYRTQGRIGGIKLRRPKLIPLV